MVVRELFAKIGLTLDTASFVKAELAVEGIKKGLEFLHEKLEEAAEGFVEIFKGTGEYAEQIAIMSKATSLSTDTLQELRYAANLSGISFEELAQSAQFLGTNMAKAGDGEATAAAAFKHLGLSVKDGGGKLKDVGDMFDEVAESMGKMPDGARKLEVARSIFGRAGDRLLPLLGEGKEGLAELRKEAHELGLVLSKEEVAAGDEFARNLKKLNFAGEGLRNEIAGPLMEALKDLTGEMVEWAKSHRLVIREKLHGFILGLKAAFKAMGTVLGWAITVFGGLLAVVSWVGQKFEWFALILGSAVGAAILANIAGIISTILWYGALSIQAAIAGGAMVLAWLEAAAPVILLAALLFMLYVALEDLWVSVTTGEGVFADFWAAIMDSDTVWALKQFFAAIPAWASAAVDKVKAFFSGLWEFIKVGAQIAIEAIPGGKWALGKLTGSTGTTPAATADLTTSPMFGGGSTSPGASAAVAGATSNSNQSLNYQPQVNAPITINAPPGSSPAAIASETQARLDDVNTRQLREAHAAVGR